MARRPLGYRTARKQQAEPLARAAPIGGFNGKDALATMPPQDAYVLDNWFPQQDGCITRNGCIEHATELGGDVRTIAVWAGGTTPKLLGFANGEIFDNTAGGAATSPLATGRTSDDVITTMFSNAGDQFLIGVNGADEPFSYGDAGYTGLVITGVTDGQENLAYVHSYAKRLFFCATGELGFYYLAVEAIQGAAEYFDLSQVFRRGGYLVSIGSYSQDTGDGPDDFVFFVSSEGEIAIYTGTDPGDAAFWAKVGTYVLGRPIGRRSVAPFGGDSLLITEMGVLPVSVLFRSQKPTPTEDAITAKLGSALTVHYGYRTYYGWHIVMHPTSNMLILNVPIGDNYWQYVMNTVTGAWCRFKGWDALCFAEMGGNLYFGGQDGVIYQADTGSSDNGEPIRCDAKTAFDYFGKPELKHWLNATLMLQFLDEPPPVSAAYSTDYKENEPQYVGEAGTGGGNAWDDTPWDTSSWGATLQVTRKWLDLNRDGFAGSLWLRVEVSTTALKWFAVQYNYTLGGVVGGSI